MKKITVNLPGKSYTLTIGAGALQELPGAVKDIAVKGRALVVTDDHVNELYGSKVRKPLDQAGIESHMLSLEPGEPTKSFDGLSRIYETLSNRGYTRSDVLIALGGGVIGDLSGYAAATWQRGMKLIQVPTTLVSQIDSSIGGKTAINTPWGKNLVGAFKQPGAVIIDTDVLKTLNDVDFGGGMAEVIKTACLTDMVSFDDILEAGGRKGIVPILPEIIAQCCEYKRQIVENDEQDLGQRMALNLGHTLAHGLEPMGNWMRWTHGQAVSIGLVRILVCAQDAGLTKAGTAKKVEQTLALYGLPTKWPDVDEAQLSDILRRDKKVKGDHITLSLVRDIGQSFLYELSLNDIDSFFQLGRGRD